MTNAKQAMPPKTIFFHEDAFQKTDQTIIRWLGNSGILLKQPWYLYHGRSGPRRI